MEEMLKNYIFRLLFYSFPLISVIMVIKAVTYIQKCPLFIENFAYYQNRIQIIRYRYENTLKLLNDL